LTLRQYNGLIPSALHFSFSFLNVRCRKLWEYGIISTLDWEGTVNVCLKMWRYPYATVRERFFLYSTIFFCRLLLLPTYSSVFSWCWPRPLFCFSLVGGRLSRLAAKGWEEGWKWVTCHGLNSIQPTHPNCHHTIN
jgi:hypothetical protein